MCACVCVYVCVYVCMCVCMCMRICKENSRSSCDSSFPLCVCHPWVSVCFGHCSVIVRMTESIEIATPPKSTKSRNPNFSVQNQIKPRSQLSFWILVNFGEGAFSVETVIYTSSSTPCVCIVRACACMCVCVCVFLSAFLRVC